MWIFLNGNELDTLYFYHMVKMLDSFTIFIKKTKEVAKSGVSSYSRRYSNHRDSTPYLISHVHLVICRIVYNIPWSYTNSNCIHYSVIRVYHRHCIRIWFSSIVGYINLKGRRIVCNTSWMIANVKLVDYGSIF